MKNHALFGGSVLAALLVSTAVQADVTAEDVWQNWQAFNESIGQTLAAGSESRVGDTLTIGDLVQSVTDEFITVGMKTDMVNFRERGDGTVEVTMSPSYPLLMTIASPEGDTVTAEIQVSQPDLVMIASGTPAEMSYDVAGPEISFSLTRLESAGEPVDMTIDAAMTGVEASYTVKGTDTKDVTTTFRADALTFNLAAKKPDNGGTLAIQGTIQQFAGASSGTFNSAMDLTNMPEALKAGLAAAGSLTYGPGSYSFDFNDNGDEMHATATEAGAYFNFALDKAHMGYAGGGSGVDITVSGSQIPFPEINVKYDEIALDLQMPIEKSETPGDFRLLTKIVGLSVSDFLWMMADPSGQLPHDPATLVIDTKGKANWFVDILDPEAAATMGDEVPGQIHALDIDEVRLSAVGAELTGSGGFTFDNNDLETFGGLPAPTGQLDLQLVGGNGLLDKLVAMGLVPQDQADFGRMMMGLFARPGNGEDTITSTIEVKDGGVYANGQRLQ